MQRPVMLLAACLALGAWSGATSTGCAVGAPPPLAPYPSPVVQSATACERAGARLQELNCRKPDGSPWWFTPSGSPFSGACERAAADGRNWHPESIATIRSCDELEAAYRGQR